MKLKISIVILILLFSSMSFAEEKRWIGKTNSKGHITTPKKPRKSSPKYLPKPKFTPYPNVYIEDGDGKKHHLGKYGTSK